MRLNISTEGRLRGHLSHLEIAQCDSICDLLAHPLQTLNAMDSHVFDDFGDVWLSVSTNLMIRKVTRCCCRGLSWGAGRGIEKAGENVLVGFCKISVVLSDTKTLVTCSHRASRILFASLIYLLLIIFLLQRMKNENPLRPFKVYAEPTLALYSCRHTKYFNCYL